LQLKQVVFWLVYTLLGVWGQFLLPGVDFFSPGLVVLLQVKSLKPAFWLCLAWILIQEGTGTLAFGTAMLFYAGLVSAFYWAAIFFEARNVLFSAVFFLFLAGFKSALIRIMSSVQDLAPAVHMEPESFLIQFGAYFGIWLITSHMYRKFLIHEPVQGK